MLYCKITKNVTFPDIICSMNTNAKEYVPECDCIKAAEARVPSGQVEVIT